MAPTASNWSQPGHVSSVRCVCMCGCVSKGRTDNSHVDRHWIHIPKLFNTGCGLLFNQGRDYTHHKRNETVGIIPAVVGSPVNGAITNGSYHLSKNGQSSL